MSQLGPALFFQIFLPTIGKAQKMDDIPHTRQNSPRGPARMGDTPFQSSYKGLHKLQRTAREAVDISLGFCAEQKRNDISSVAYARFIFDVSRAGKGFLKLEDQRIKDGHAHRRSWVID
jgi:hypothetical protein